MKSMNQLIGHSRDLVSVRMPYGWIKAEVIFIEPDYIWAWVENKLKCFHNGDWGLIF